MKLFSFEISGLNGQLTYTDAGQGPNDSQHLLVVRLPMQGPMKRPMLWHQLMLLREAQNVLEAEAQRVRAELETQD